MPDEIVNSPLKPEPLITLNLDIPKEVVVEKKPKKDYLASFKAWYKLKFDVKYYSNLQWDKRCKFENKGQENLPKYWDKLSDMNKERWINEFMLDSFKEIMLVGKND